VKLAASHIVTTTSSRAVLGVTYQTVPQNGIQMWRHLPSCFYCYVAEVWIGSWTLQQWKGVLWRSTDIFQMLNSVSAYSIHLCVHIALIQICFKLRTVTTDATMRSISLVSYPVGTGGSFPRGKAAGAWSWPLTSIWCRGQEWVELYFHSPNKS
jgi:hypothetical protein